MLKQIVQDEELVHRHLVKARSIPRRFVQDEALQSESRKSVRDDPHWQVSRQVVQVQDKDLGHGHFVQDEFRLVVQDKDIVHRHFVKDRYSILRRFVQDEALQINNRQPVRDDPQMVMQVVQDEDLELRHFVRDRYPIPRRFVQDEELQI